MHIEEKALRHWMDNFYGYGSWEARIWFIAYEENGGDLPEEVAEKLNWFYGGHPPGTQPALCDIRELYRHASARIDGPKSALFETLYDHRFGSNAILHGGWKNLIAFHHGYRGKKVPDLLAYQKKTFVLPSQKDEALILLYPLPSPHNHAWYYSWLDMPEFPFLKSRTMYQDHLFEGRVKCILSNVGRHKPDVVVMYGMDNINRLKESVQAVFPSAVFRKVNAIRQQIPQHHLADLGGTLLIITTQVPTLRHNRIESGFDWEAFGKMERAGRDY